MPPRKKRRKKFPLKSKPKKPKQQTVYKRYDIHDYDDTGQSVLTRLLKIQEEGVDLVNVRFNKDYSYSETTTWFSYEQSEDATIFAKRVKDYEKKLATYNKWYTKYENKIERELEFRAEEKVLKGLSTRRFPNNEI